MADVENAVRTRLTAYAGTAALIGTRAYYGMLPQAPTLPASVVQQISGPRNSAMGADVDKFEARVQVKSHALTRSAAKGLAEQSRLALQRFSGTSAGTVVIDSRLVDEDTEMEPESNIWSVRQDYMVWVSE